MSITAHSVTEHLALLQMYPAHEPRETDPHYKTFNQTRARMKRLGLLTCWINNSDCDTAHPIELHHALVEYALANIVDVEQFERLYPEFHVTDDDSFRDWINSEAGLLPLCKMHHTGILGVHVIHYPGWVVQRFMKAGIAAPERKVVPTPK